MIRRLMIACLTAMLLCGQAAADTATLENLVEVSIGARSMDGNTSRAKMMKSVLSQGVGQKIPGSFTVYVVDFGDTLLIVMELGALKLANPDQVQKLADTLVGVAAKWKAELGTDIDFLVGQPGQLVPQAIVTSERAIVLFK